MFIARNWLHQNIIHNRGLEICFGSRQDERIKDIFKASLKASMRHLITFIFAYLILLNSAAAEVSKNLTYSYYDVSVRHDQPLRPQLLAATPIREEGSPFIGITKWDIRWSFIFNVDWNGYCRITNSSTELIADILLPRLSGASGEQTSSFKDFIVILRQHELGHYNIAEEAAQKIDSDLRKTPAMGNCKMLEDYANTMSRKTLDRFNEKSRQYDSDTQHGEIQAYGGFSNLSINTNTSDKTAGADQVRTNNSPLDGHK